VNPKSADFSHAKTRLLYADVWQKLALIRGFFWRRFTPGANSLLKTAAQVRMTGKIRMRGRIIRTFGVHRDTAAVSGIINTMNVNTRSILLSYFIFGNQ
jgi:hypothetical protein